MLKDWCFCGWEGVHLLNNVSQAHHKIESDVSLTAVIFESWLTSRENLSNSYEISMTGQRSV